MRLTNKDLNLLFELSENSRTGYSKIGKKIRMSQQLISYKVKSYAHKGLIRSFFPVIDYAKLGYLSFRVFFKINYTNKNNFVSLLNKISKNNTITEIIECGGSYDVIITFSTKNPSAFNKVMKEIIYDYPNLKDYMILTNVVSHNFPRKYLVDMKNNIRDTIVGGDREVFSIDSVDKKILFELQKSAIKSSIEIASSIKVSTKTVISRIRKLEKNKILLGYKPLLNLPAIDYKLNKIFLTHHNLSRKREQNLINFCKTTPNVTGVIKLFGGWDVEINVETKTMEKFREIYTELREKFQDIIKDIESFPLYNIHKQQYMPDIFFE
ncbi:Lrp/AsnC family transcriptional regulator [Candidatus Aenigmatarchaeota archaeon]